MFFALSDNFTCSVDLISKCTSYYRMQFLIAVLRACAATLASRLSPVGDPFPPFVCLDSRSPYSNHGPLLKHSIRTVSVGDAPEDGHAKAQKHAQETPDGWAHLWVDDGQTQGRHLGHPLTSGQQLLPALLVRSAASPFSASPRSLGAEPPARC